MADEAKHFAVLNRYLTEKLEAIYPAHPSLIAVFSALSEARDCLVNVDAFGPPEPGTARPGVVTGVVCQVHVAPPSVVFKTCA